MIPIKFYIGLVVAIVLAVGGTLFYQHYVSLLEASALSDQRKATASNTVSTIDDGVLAAEVAAEVERILASNRTEFQTNQTKAKADDPKLADRASRVVDKRVRDNFTQRRLARERLDCLQGKCEDFNAPDPSP